MADARLLLAEGTLMYYTHVGVGGPVCVGLDALR